MDLGPRRTPTLTSHRAFGLPSMVSSFHIPFWQVGRGHPFLEKRLVSWVRRFLGAMRWRGVLHPGVGALLRR